MHNYTKIKDLHSRIITSLPNLYASFQSSPKINRILITRSFPYNESRHDSYPQFPRSSLGTRGLQTRSDKKKNDCILRVSRCSKHARLKRKSEEEERRRGKSNGCSLSVYGGTSPLRNLHSEDTTFVQGKIFTQSLYLLPLGYRRDTSF